MISGQIRRCFIFDTIDEELKICSLINDIKFQLLQDYCQKRDKICSLIYQMINMDN